jgi:hypothetical protein
MYLYLLFLEFFKAANNVSVSMRNGIATSLKPSGEAMPHGAKN